MQRLSQRRNAQPCVARWTLPSTRASNCMRCSDLHQEQRTFPHEQPRLPKNGVQQKRAQRRQAVTYSHCGSRGDCSGRGPICSIEVPFADGRNMSSVRCAALSSRAAAGTSCDCSAG